MSDIEIKNVGNENKNIMNSIILIVLIIFAFFLVKFLLFNNDDKDSDSYAILLNVGEIYSFDNDTPELSWSSSDEAVVYVDNDGNVKAIGVGIATIVACDENGEVYRYTIKIIDNVDNIGDNSSDSNNDGNNYDNNDKVVNDDGANNNNNNLNDDENGSVNDNSDNKEDTGKKEENNKLKKIEFSSLNVTIYVNDKYQSSIIFTPSILSSDVTYDSSNSDVALVSSAGVITGVSEGEAVITARTSELSTEMNVKVIKNNNKTITIKFNNNGSDKISSNTEKCTSSGNGCKIKLPTITRNGYQILGWSKNSDSLIAEYKVGDSITVYGDTVYYAITSRELVATFNGNGASVTSNQKKCTIYNTNNSCDIVTPDIVREGYNIIGFGNSSSATSKSIGVGEKVTLKGNASYYAITYKTLTATFDANKATISKNSASCNIYNTASSCNVTTPSISRANYAVLGWGNSSDTASIVAKAEASLSLTKSLSYYAITKINVDGIEKGCTGWMAASDYYYSSASTSSSKTSINVGTVFTIEDVSGDYFKVSIPNVSGYKYILHKYVMINLADYIPSMVFEITNASSSIHKSSGYSLPGVTGTKLYSTGKIYNVRLRKDEYMAPVLYAVARKLLTAQKTLLSQGYSIKVYDTYRPRSVSTKIYTALCSLYDSNSTVKNNILYSYGASGTRYTWGKSWFAAKGISTHNVGAAIDMSMVNKSTGEEVEMPTAMNELSTKAIKYYSPSVSKVPANYAKEMNDNAKILDSAATGAGLSTLASEWWHFQDTSAYNLILGLEENGCDFSVTKVYSY